jgi:FlaA1/EpsC-like NDP-sugar epimerase
LNQPRINTRWYILCDIIGAVLTWLCFYFLRTVIYHYHFTIPPGFYVGLILYTIGWTFLHSLSGAYEFIYHKSTIIEIFRTLIVSFIGCLALLFFFILKNPQENNMNYYLEFYSLLIPIFIVTLFNRLLWLTIAQRQLKNKEVYFNTLLIGSGKNFDQFYDTFQLAEKSGGYTITSFLHLNGNDTIKAVNKVNSYSGLHLLNRIIEKDKIEEVIIAVEKNDRDLLVKILH